MTQTKRWTVTDVDNGTWIESLELSAEDLGAKTSSGASITKRTLHGGLSEGVDVIEVNNGILSFTILPTRGMGIWRGTYKGNFIGWKSPVRGPVNPMFVHADERGGLGWLGGFDECIVRCGLESNGAPGEDVLPNNMGEPTKMGLTLHGRIANVPAHYVEISVKKGPQPELHITGVVEEAMLFCPQFRLTTRISTKIGSNSFSISDEITNLKSTNSEMELLYHCNFGKPFMDKGATLVLPAIETAPRSVYPLKDVEAWSRYLGPTAGYTEQCFWHAPLGKSNGDTLALLKNAAGTKGVACRYNVKQLPCFTQWKNSGAESDGYVTGLEPAVNYPNPRMFERNRGRVIKMKPGAKHRVDMEFEFADTAVGVNKLVKEIAAIQGKKAHTIHGKPLAKYSML